MTTPTLKYRYSNVGYCQIHYSCRNSDDLPVYYCLMEENDIRVKLYRCSEDGEADYPVKPVNKSKIKLEIPPDHYGQVVLERFLTENSYASPQEIKL